MSKKLKPQKVISLLLSMAVITITVVLLSRWLSKPVEAAWYNDSWQYRTKITITNTGAAVTNQKVKFDIATDALVTAGKIQSDCGDSRFVSSTGEILRYYLDTGGGACNTNSTDYYVLIPSINAGSVVLYHYYGNMAMVNGTEGANFSESTFSPNTSSAASEEQSVAPIAYWKFDEKGGSTASDATGQGNTGTLTSAVWNPRENCLVNNCLMFTGSNSFVTTSLQVSPAQYTSLTMMAWVRPIDVQGAYGNIMGGDDGGYDRSFGFTTSQFQIQVGNQGWTPGVNADIGKWQHVAVVYSPSQITFYKNGVASHYNSGGSFGTSVQGLEIGKDSACGGCYFKGYMDEAKVYGRALTASEVLQAYKKPGETGPVSAAMSQNAVDANGPSFLSDGLVGYWHLDESSGNYFDYTGNGLTITDNGTTLGAAGKYGLGRDFNGTSQYGTVADSSTLDLPVTANRITVSAWINWDGNGFTDAGVITRKLTASGAGAAPWGVHDLYLTTSNKMAFRITDGVNGGSESIAIGNTTISSGTWYHVVGTYDGSNVRIFVNGVQDGISSTTLTMGNTAHPFLIGKDTISSNGNNFNGKIDDLRLYNRAFPSTDVATLYAFRPTPLVYWNLDEGTGTTANEPNGYNGTAVVNAWTQGKYGKALAMNGTTQYIQNTAVTAFNPAYAFTLEFWVYSTVDSGSIIWGEISSGTTCNGNPQIWKDGSNNITLGRCGNGAGPNVGPSSAFLNGWHHVAFSYDGTNTYAYKNGVLMSTYTFTWPSIASSKFRMGADRDTVLTGLLTGKLDEVRLYNYPRTQKEIVSDMNAGHANVGSPIASALAHWKFDEANDNTCQPGTDGCNFGSLGPTLATVGFAGGSNAPAWSTSGKFDKAIDFTRSQGDFATTADASWNQFGTGDFTVSAWVYPRGVSYGPTGAATIISKDYTGFEFAIYEGQMIGFIGGASNACASRSFMTANRWYHMTLTRTSGVMRGYVDGKQECQAANSASASNIGTTIYLGARPGNAESYLDGRLDEIKIYNYGLSADEVKLDYNRSSSIVLGTEDSGQNLQDGAGNTPTGEWKFNEKTGTNAYDTSSNGRTGTITTAEWKTAASCKTGPCLQFDSTDRVDTYDAGFTTTFSGSAFINPTAVNTTYAIMGERGGSAGWAFYTRATGELGFTVSGVADYNSTGAGLVAGQWQHVAFTVNGTAVRIYLNGRLVHSPTTASNVTSDTTHLFIGNDGAANYFSGLIDEVKVYNYTRTPAQIAQDYNGGSPVALWKFDECQGATAYNSAPNGSSFNAQDGTLTPVSSGNTTTGSCNSGTSTEMWNDGTIGKFNSSVGLDGTDDYVTVADHNNIDQSSSTSIAAWVYVNTLKNYNQIFTKGTDGNENYEAYISSTGAIGGEWTFNTGRANCSNSGSTNLAAGAWYHFVVTFESGVGCKSYINGTLVWSAPKTATTLTTFSTPLIIGADTSAAGRYFDGRIDDVRIYNYALSHTQIKEVMSNGGIYFGPATGTP